MPFLLFREGRKGQSSASWMCIKNRRPTLGSRSALRRARVYRCSRGVQQGEGGSSEEALIILGAASCPIRPCHQLPAQRWAEAGHTAMECGYRCCLADGSTAGGLAPYMPLIFPEQGLRFEAHSASVLRQAELVRLTTRSHTPPLLQNGRLNIYCQLS